MMEDLIQVAGMKAAPIITVATPMLQKWYNDLDILYHEFNKAQDGEMQGIIKAYSKFCINEIKHAVSTMKVGRDVGNNENNNKEPDKWKLPIYFEMRRDAKIPLLYDLKFCPNKDAYHWTEYVLDTFPLKHYVENIIGYICEYQISRDKRIFTRKGYNYDPTNLFFEEFKWWLIMLSRVALDTNMDNISVEMIVRGRIDYLNYIFSNHVFNPEEENPSRLQIIDKIKEILEKQVIQQIQLDNSRKSAREHFKSLKQNVYLSLKYGMKLLFFIFRNEETPESFILDEIRKPNLPVYIKNANDTSTKILQHLFNSPAFILVFPQIKHSGEDVIGRVSNLIRNPFRNKEGVIKFPSLVLNQLNPANSNILAKDNWFVNSKKQPSGILKHFSTQENMDIFLTLHAHLYDLCLFYSICDQIYDLAGHGGDLMVYGLAANMVQDAMRAYETLLEEVKKTTQFLYGLAETHHKTAIIDNNHKKNVTNDDKRWGENFGIISEAYRNFEKNISACKNSLQVVQNGIIKVNQAEYSEQVKFQLRSFSELVDGFVMGNKSRLIQSSGIKFSYDPNNANYLFSKKTKLRYRRETLKQLVKSSNANNNNNSDMNDDEFEKYVNEAIKLNEKNDFLKAAEIFRKLLEIKPHEFDLRLELSFALHSTKQYIEAIECLTPIIDNDSSEYWGRALFFRAMAKESSNDLKGALDDLDRLLSASNEQDSTLIRAKYVNIQGRMNLNNDTVIRM